MNVVSATDIPCTTGMTATQPVPARSAYLDVVPFAQWLEHAAKTLVFCRAEIRDASDCLVASGTASLRIRRKRSQWSP